MAWFKRRGGGSDEFFVTIDPTAGDPTIGAILADLRAGRWEPAAEAFAGIDDPRRRELAMLRATDTGPIEAYDRWVATQPGSGTAHLARGLRRITAAWEIRGDGYAETVEADAWPRFHQGLRDAEEDLFRAADIDPTDPVPWTALLMSGRGLSISKEELRIRFEAGRRLHGGMPMAHQQMLSGLVPRWGGSWEEVGAFVADTAGQALPGSTLHALVPGVYIEIAVEDGRSSLGADARQDIAGALERGPFHPAWEDGAVAVGALNLFACACFFVELKAETRRLLEMIGPRQSDHPWAYWGGPKLFEAVRESARRR